MNNEISKVAIPATRNPFVNAQLVSAGTDPVTGEERFWDSALNYIDGCLGALVTESGSNRLYRFNAEKDEKLFYGAVYAGKDIMWLTAFLDTITKLNLKTGETETFGTGMPHSLSVSGIAYDDKTGKIFWGAYCQDDMKKKGISFDTNTNKVEKIFDDIPIKNNQMRYCVKNPDGTFTLICGVPDIELLLWNPADDTLEVILESFKMGPNLRLLDYAKVVQREDGAIFLPAYGWFDPIKREIAEGLMPSVDAAWFDTDSKYAYGSRTMPLGNTVLYKWDLESGEITMLAEIPDALSFSFKLTQNKKIVCINLYGFFYRIDTVTGAIEASLKLDSDGIGHIDCIYRIDEERLLCTPFITQRFYEINLKTGKGYDLGRATGGLGEVLQVAGMDGKIYMASYTKGQLVEYDPSQPAHFPENPRIVTAPAGKPMRPVDMCQNEDTIFYSCSHEYGHLGSTMIRYTPSAGKSVFAESPIENHMIRSLAYDDGLDKLIAATTYHADCRSCVPKDEFFILAILDIDSMMPEKTIKVNAEQEYFHIFGQFADSRYLCGGSGAHMELEDGYTFFTFDAVSFAIEPFALPNDLLNDKLHRLCKTNTPGIYAVVTETSIDIWNLNEGYKVKSLCENPGVYKTIVQDDIVYLVCKRDIHIVPINS